MNGEQYRNALPQTGQCPKNTTQRFSSVDVARPMKSQQGIVSPHAELFPDARTLRFLHKPEQSIDHDIAHEINSSTINTFSTKILPSFQRSCEKVFRQGVRHNSINL